MRIEDRFENAISPAWDVAEIGTGRVAPSTEGLRLTVNPTERQYSNAQISDYYVREGGKLRFDFRWRPPLRMTVTAWVKVGGGQPIGTAGFGFWNHPFSPDIKRLPRLPQAIWFFFGSPPNNMQLAYGVPGHGWKAATIDATRALYLAPFALPAVLLMRIPRLYKRLWQPIQRRLNIGEAALDVGLLATRHTYRIDWQVNRAIFTIDDNVVLETPFAPRGALGFVAWVDNQYAIVTPQGNFGFGVIKVEQEQTMVLEQVVIDG